MDKIKVHHKDAMAYYEIGYFMKDYINKNTIVICIGTDRCIGDVVGPLAGTILKEKGFPYPVYGTVAEPIHALNLEKRLNEIKNIHPKANIIGIDACLGDNDDIGEIHCRDYPIHPGKGVGKSLPDIGQTSVIGIVDSSDNNEFFTNRTIRLHLVMSIANKIADGLIHAVYLKKGADPSCLEVV